MQLITFELMKWLEIKTHRMHMLRIPRVLMISQSVRHYRDCGAHGEFVCITSRWNYPVVIVDDSESPSFSSYSFP
jgi:hypothetical protein